MRSIHAWLTTQQQNLYGRPAHSILIGTATSYDATADLITYIYDERAQLPGKHLIYLDNATGKYNSLTGDQAKITQGAIIEIKRGEVILGDDYTAELPRLWIESWDYQFGAGKSLFVIQGIDAWGKLYHHRLASVQTWSATSATTILEWILTQVGLTRLTGSMTALTFDFEIGTSERLSTAIGRLMKLMPEYLYFGLDAEMKWKTFASKASTYTVGWNAAHQAIHIPHAQDRVWEVNTVTVNGADTATGSDNDATQVAAVGARRLTIHDITLTTNGECTASASAILEYYQARAESTAIITRPIHGLEMYDMITFQSPPWGGSNIVARVITIKETYDTHLGRWQQLITLGHPSRSVPQSQTDGSGIINIDAANVIAHDLAQITPYTGDLSIDGILKLVTDGVLHAGQTAYNTGTGYWFEYNGGTPRLSIGDATNEKITWDGTTLTVEGDLVAGSGNTVYPMVPLTAPLTSEDWDGDSFSTTAKTVIDLSSVFSAPAGIKAALITGEIRDSDSAVTECYLILAPNDTAGQGIAFTCPAVDDRWGRFSALVPCDGNGDIYYQIVASGAGTFDTKLQIWGYLI